MTILVIADDEFLLNKLPEANVNLVIACGDLPNDIILQAAGRVNCKQIFAVKGNHDDESPFPSPITNLHLSIQQAGDLTFGGFGGSWKYKPKGNNLYEQGEVDRFLMKFPKVDVFVTHNSPRMTHDRDDGVHLGFSAFVTYIERARPRLLLHGHQHINKESTLLVTRVIGTYGHRFLTIES